MGKINKSLLPPGPKGKFLTGHLFSFKRDSLSFLKEIADKYGDIVYFKIGPIGVTLFNHPKHIREVLSTNHHNFVKGRPLEMAKILLGEGLLTSEGSFHRQQSRIIQPAFHRRMIKSYATAMTESAEDFMKDWKDGMKLDVLDEMINMSIVIAGKALFSTDLRQEASNINRALHEVMSLFGRVAVPFSEWLLKLPLPSNIRFKKAKAKLDETIYGIIKQRQQHPIDSDDLLSILLRAQNEQNGAPGISDQQVRDEAMTLFLTAFDTTSLALAWTWYLLSQHPTAEALLFKELDQKLQGPTPTVEDVPQLKFTRMVFAESMRLFPPLYLISRQALEDFDIDQYRIPAGTIILMSPYLIHRDPRFHSDPEAFKPLSWSKKTNSQNSKYTYFPFSRGPRSCIGEHFAWMEGILVLATIAQNWQLKLAQPSSIKFLQSINLRPKNGIKMQVFRKN